MIEEQSILVDKARMGDREALDALVRCVQDDVYNLAVRMLWDPVLAADATQEILIRAVTHLSAFRGDSSFSTWIYRIAVNYLRTAKRRIVEHPELTFDRFADDLKNGNEDGPDWSASAPERRLDIEEIKIGCSQAMLLCLDRDQRLAYILGDILELPGPDAAAILDIEPAAYRQRLARARAGIIDFMRSACGLVEPSNACRCHRRLAHARKTGRLSSGDRRFATRPRSNNPDHGRVLATSSAIEGLRVEAAQIHRDNPRYTTPAETAAAFHALLHSPTYAHIFEP